MFFQLVLSFIRTLQQARDFVSIVSAVPDVASSALGKELWTKVSWREQSLQKVDKGGEYASGGGILLEVAEMAPDDLLDVDAGGMV
eukprot:g19641.t1